MAKCIFNGWDSQCCCQPVSVESHCVQRCAVERIHLSKASDNHLGLIWTCVHTLQSRRICDESDLTLLSPSSFESRT